MKLKKMYLTLFVNYQAISNAINLVLYYMEMKKLKG